MLVRRRGIQIAASAAIVALALAACSSSKKNNAATSSSPAPGASTSATPAPSGSASAPVAASSAPASPSAGGETKTGNRLTGNPDTINTATVTKGGTLTYALEKTIDNWNVLTSAGNTFETAEVMNSIWPAAFNVLPDLGPKLNADLLTSATVTSSSPQTIVYVINPKAVWSDGTPINVDDFIYQWKAQDGADCSKCDIASTTGYSQIASITGSNNGQTVTVVMKTPFSDWKSMFSSLIPYHTANPQGLDQVNLEKSWDTGFATAPPTVSGGPYVISNFQKDQSVTLTPNPKWYGANGPYLDKLVFRMITDATQEPPALQNGEIDAMYPQPEVDLISQLNGMSNVVYQLDLGLVFEHIDLNLQNPALQNVALRKALFTAVDVKGMIARTAGQTDPGITPLGNRMFVPGQNGYQDDVTSLGYGSGNVAAAKQILTAAGYKVGSTLTDPSGKAVPALSMRYTQGNAVRQTECQLFAAAAKQLGVTVNVSPTDSLGDTLTQKDANHKYDIIVFAWVATPFGSSNAALYQSDKAQGTPGNWGGNYGHYSNPAVDAALADSLTTTDPAKELADLNTADKQLSADAYTLPLYQKPVILAYNAKWGNIRDNATSVGPPYNTQDWGQIKSQ
jgi:peptide/nickel transport system substrate-binding protein